jgi:hypothetical protein
MSTINHRDVPVRAAELDEQAKAILADRNRIRGRAPRDYDADEYLEAVAQVESERVALASRTEKDFRRMLEQVLEEAGKPSKIEVDFDLLLKKFIDRMNELREKKDEQGRSFSPTDEQQLKIVRDLVRQIGTPGERRRDVEVKNGSVAAAIWDVINGVPDLQRKQLLGKLLREFNPEQMRTLLAGIKEAEDLPPAAEAADDSALHVKAEELLEAGGAKRNPRGQLVYTADEYFEAVVQAAEEG